MQHADIDFRSLLLSLYQAGLEAVAGETVTRHYLHQQDWQTDMPVAVLACGKAAPAMARGAEAVLGQRIDRGLLITKHGYGEAGLSPCWQCLEAGHPLPDEASLQAGQRLLEFVAQLPPAMPLLSLISGGTSALLEHLPPGVSLAELRRVNAWLLGSGLDIADMNRVRKAVSCLKGGKLLNYLGERPVLNLMISDVRGDDPAVIGSGLLSPQQAPLPSNLPDWLRALLAKSAACPPGLAAWPAVEQHIVARNQEACEAVAEAARARDVSVTVQPPVYGPVAEVASQLAGFLRSAAPGVYVWGGEPTLELPAQAGRGGRNQHLALSLAQAQALAGEPGISVLCGATDGSDGPGNDAGAMIDGTTVRQAADYPGDASQALAQADSGTFLAEAGALISTGPTGTNVMDLVIAIKTGPSAE